MNVKPTSAARSAQVWVSTDDASLETFKALTQRETIGAEWPLCAAIHRNVLIYDGSRVRKLVEDWESSRALMAEWVEALSAGPGVIVIRNTVADTGVLDRATDLFAMMIEEQRQADSRGGDHFAKPGANERIWNSAQKHCLRDPANFARYFGNVILDLVSRAWLGDGYQMTAQVNCVNPGGKPQLPHRDYHLGFMSPKCIEALPAHVHRLSPLLTLQGAIAHCDMPVDSGPTMYLPYSHKLLEGYLAFSRPEYQRWFQQHHVQLPLEKGDAVFFNPALMHAAGANISKDVYRMANLLQVSSAFGRAMESMDRASMVIALYPELLKASADGRMSPGEIDCAVSMAADGYAFPTNLDSDPPLDGLAPATQCDVTREAVRNATSPERFAQLVSEQTGRRWP